MFNAERLLGHGDFLLVNKGRVVRFQAAYLSAGEFSQITNEIWNGRRQPMLLASSSQNG